MCNFYIKRAKRNCKINGKYNGFCKRHMKQAKHEEVSQEKKEKNDKNNNRKLRLVINEKTDDLETTDIIFNMKKGNKGILDDWEMDCLWINYVINGNNFITPNNYRSFYIDNKRDWDDYQEERERFLEEDVDEDDWKIHEGNFDEKWYVVYSEEFLRKHSDKVLDWEHMIVKNQPLSEKFLEDFGDELGWGRIDKYQFLSDEFVRKNKDKLDR